MEPSPANPSWRKPVGMIGLLAYITIWVVLVASLSGIVWEWHWALQAVFYLIAGIVWIAPLKPALAWMETGKWR